MAKGTYDVQSTKGRSQYDTSFRSMLCALLIFFILCMILIIAGNWSSIVGWPQKDEKIYKKDVEEYIGHQHSYEKLKEFESKTTKSSNIEDIKSENNGLNNNSNNKQSTTINYKVEITTKKTTTTNVKETDHTKNLSLYSTTEETILKQTINENKNYDFTTTAKTSLASELENENKITKDIPVSDNTNLIEDVTETLSNANNKDETNTNVPTTTINLLNEITTLNNIKVTNKNTLEETYNIVKTSQNVFDKTVTNVYDNVGFLPREYNANTIRSTTVNNEDNKTSNNTIADNFSASTTELSNNEKNIDNLEKFMSVSTTEITKTSKKTDEDEIVSNIYGNLGESKTRNDKTSNIESTTTNDKDDNTLSSEYIDKASTDNLNSNYLINTNSNNVNDNTKEDKINNAKTEVIQIYNDDQDQTSEKTDDKFVNHIYNNLDENITRNDDTTNIESNLINDKDDNTLSSETIYLFSTATTESNLNFENANKINGRFEYNEDEKVTTNNKRFTTNIEEYTRYMPKRIDKNSPAKIEITEIDNLEDKFSTSFTTELNTNNKDVIFNKQTNTTTQMIKNDSLMLEDNINQSFRTENNTNKEKTEIDPESVTEETQTNKLEEIIISTTTKQIERYDNQIYKNINDEENTIATTTQSSSTNKATTTFNKQINNTTETTENNNLILEDNINQSFTTENNTNKEKTEIDPESVTEETQTNKLEEIIISTTTKQIERYDNQIYKNINDEENTIATTTQSSSTNKATTTFNKQINNTTETTENNNLILEDNINQSFTTENNTNKEKTEIDPESVTEETQTNKLEEIIISTTTKQIEKYDNQIYKNINDEENTIATTTQSSSTNKATTTFNKQINNTTETTENNNLILEDNINQSFTTENNTNKEKTDIIPESVSEQMQSNKLDAIIEENIIATTTQSSSTNKNLLREVQQEIVSETIDSGITSTTTEKEKISDEGSNDSALYRKSQPVCHTLGCKSVGSRMLSLMDHSIDACEDFYAFSCGGMLQEYADSDTWSILLEQTMQINESSPKHLIKYRTFYNSCIEFNYNYDYKNRIEKVKDILQTKGLESYEAVELLNITDIFSIMVSLKSMYFMDIGNSIDKQSSEFILQLGLPEESLDETHLWSALWANQRRCMGDHKIYRPSSSNLNMVTEMYGSYSKCRHDLTEFEDLLRNAIDAFGFQENSRINGTVIETLNDIKKLLKVYPSNLEIKEAIINKEFKVYQISHLQKKYPYIEWIELLKLLTDADIQETTLIQVYFENWLEELKLLKEKKQMLINMLLVDLYYNFVIQRSTVDVEIKCMQLTSNMFSDISSNLYINTFSEHIVERQESRVNKLFEFLKRNLHYLLLNINETSAMEKLYNLKAIFSNKNNECNEDLPEKYKNLEVSQNYQINVVNIKEFKMQQLLNQEKHAFGRLANSYDVKPTVLYESNSIYVPMGMVKSVPFNATDIIEFSKIGLHLAKAIEKHFDPIGVHYKMILRNEISPLIENNNNLYMYKVDNNFKDSMNLSLNERISDSTALKLLTDVYPLLNETAGIPWLSPEYSTEKIFFISMAQEYCEKISQMDYMLRVHESSILPSSIRVNNMILNSERFSEVFECLKGSGMYDPFKIEEEDAVQSN